MARCFRTISVSHIPKLLLMNTELPVQTTGLHYNFLINIEQKQYKLTYWNNTVGSVLKTTLCNFNMAFMPKINQRDI